MRWSHCMTADSLDLLYLYMDFECLLASNGYANSVILLSVLMSLMALHNHMGQMLDINQAIPRDSRDRSLVVWNERSCARILPLRSVFGCFRRGGPSGRMSSDFVKAMITSIFRRHSTTTRFQIFILLSESHPYLTFVRILSVPLC